MNKEDLLKDRYKVIADYLFSPYKIGDIIEVTDNLRQVHLATINVREMGENVKQECFYDIDDCGLYPAIFQEIEWWEERRIKEMPTYLKDGSGEVWRVYEYHVNSSYVLLYKNVKDEQKPYGDHSLYELIPATEQEYNEYSKPK